MELFRLGDLGEGFVNIHEPFLLGDISKILIKGGPFEILSICRCLKISG